MDEERQQQIVAGAKLTPTEEQAAIAAWRFLVRTMEELGRRREAEIRAAAARPGNLARQIRLEEVVGDAAGPERLWKNVEWLLGELAADRQAIMDGLEALQKDLEWLKEDERRIRRYVRRLQRGQEAP